MPCQGRCRAGGDPSSRRVPLVIVTRRPSGSLVAGRTAALLCFLAGAAAALAFALLVRPLPGDTGPDGRRAVSPLRPGTDTRVLRPERYRAWRRHLQDLGLPAPLGWLAEDGDGRGRFVLALVGEEAAAYDAWELALLRGLEAGGEDGSAKREAVSQGADAAGAAARTPSGTAPVPATRSERNPAGAGMAGAAPPAGQETSPAARGAAIRRLATLGGQLDAALEALAARVNAGAPAGAGKTASGQAQAPATAPAPIAAARREGTGDPPEADGHAAAPESSFSPLPAPHPLQLEGVARLTLSDPAPRLNGPRLRLSRFVPVPDGERPGLEASLGAKTRVDRAAVDKLLSAAPGLRPGGEEAGAQADGALLVLVQPDCPPCSAVMSLFAALRERVRFPVRFLPLGRRGQDAYQATAEPTADQRAIMEGWCRAAAAFMETALPDVRATPAYVWLRDGEARGGTLDARELTVLVDLLNAGA